MTTDAVSRVQEPKTQEDQRGQHAPLPPTSQPLRAIGADPTGPRGEPREAPDEGGGEEVGYGYGV
ncbi:MAG TPA: hypothetical protein VJP86_11460 [Vicinamibacterales bacterium]|jgi:hypothetical protein|nr:hypothetical protein [Vicinamibacterales bacterium]